MTTRSDYTVEREKNIVLVTDLDRGGRSVTNDAVEVINDLAKRFADLRHCVVLYRDSMGLWDQMVLSHEGRFRRFHPVRAATRKAALNWANEHVWRRPDRRPQE